MVDKAFFIQQTWLMCMVNNRWYIVCIIIYDVIITFITIIK